MFISSLINSLTIFIIPQSVDYNVAKIASSDKGLTVSLTIVTIA